MVVIKGMEMPKNCAECKLFHFYFDIDGIVHCVCKCRNMEICGDLDKRNDLCPLIMVESMPSVTPKFTDSEIQKIQELEQAQLEKAYELGRAEIQPSEDCIRELIREFDNKHPALFANYMREFNDHPISEIIEYMWDMHDLIEDIKYRLPN